MSGTTDRTGSAPVRRMAVARAMLAPGQQLDAASEKVASAAAILAVKSAATLLPFLEPFHATHVDVDFRSDDDGLHCTLTVQAYARADLGAAALLGVAAALASVADDSSRITDLHIVQQVEG